MDNKKVLIAGGSGFIGQKLTSLLIDRGYDVSTLTRTPKNSKDIFWNPKKKEINLSQLSEIDVLVNLVGENIGLGRWTKKRKKELVDSRVDSTTFLCEIAEKMPKLSYFISASAINCYGKESDKIHKESDDFGDNFLSQLIKSWENASDKLASKIPVAKLRIPIVLSENDGALVRIKKITNFGLGAPLGSGKQTMPWIHIADLCRLFAFAIDKKLVGSYNVNAGLDSNKDFMKSVALSMKRPFFLPPVPSFLLKLFLGEQACIVLEGIKVSNEKIRAAGFTFQDTTLSSALKKT
jgi:uncharacterized protein (TIGR01777 family)